MLDTYTKENLPIDIVAAEERNNSIRCTSKEVNQISSNAYKTNEGTMRQVTFVYDNGAPYVCTLSIDSSSGSFHSKVTSLVYLEKMENQRRETSTNNQNGTVGTTTVDAISISSSSTTTINVTDPELPYLETWRNLCKPRANSNLQNITILE